MKLSILIAALCAVSAGGANDVANASSTVANAAANAAENAKANKSHEELEAELASARADLERSVQEVARVSAEMSRSVIEGIGSYIDGSPRSVVGVVFRDDGNDAEGARIQSVSPGGAAAEAGLRAGDVIVSIDGVRVSGDYTNRQAVKLMRKVAANSKMKVHIKRGKQEMDLVVVPRPATHAYPQRFVFNGMPIPGVPAPGMPGAPGVPAVPGVPGGPAVPGAPGAPGADGQNYFYSRLGQIGGRGLMDMEFATLTPQLGHYFGTEKGVLVLRAPSDSKFKLVSGDVILSIDGREPTSGSHVIRILSSYQPGEKIILHIMREHKAMDLETSVPGVQRMHTPHEFRAPPTEPESNS